MTPRGPISIYPAPRGTQEATLSLEAVRAVWDRQKVNTLRLESCRRHVFTVDLAPERDLTKCWQCTECRGEVDELGKLWYEAGLRHAVSAP